MRQIAYPTALGSCALAAAGPPARAAEWSITPVYSASADYDSNRRLIAGGKASDAGVLAVDLKFKRAVEDLELALEPVCQLRRFTDETFGNGNDYQLNAAATWSAGERSALSLRGSYLDQSTLTTELQETGIISGDTHQRNAQASGNWNWNHSELRGLVAQFAFSKVSYYGESARLLPGYRYSSGSIGERFNFSERGSLTLTAVADGLSSSAAGNSSHEAGVQAEVVYSFSERFNIDASVGRTRRTLDNQTSNGTNASVVLNYLFTSNKLSVQYARSLVPYGTGFLVERQQYTGSYTHTFNELMDASVSYVRIKNNETAVLLRLDRRSFDDVSFGLNWHPRETIAVGVKADAIRSDTFAASGGTVKSWRGSLSLTWAPHPTAMSR